MAAETGTPNGKVGKKSRCEGCALPPPQKEGLDAALISHTQTLQELASRFGGSKSAIARHSKHVAGAVIRATARTVAPPPDTAEIAVYEDKLLAEMLSVHAVTREELDAARKGPDKRLVVVLLGQLRENIAHLGKMMPASDTTPHVVVEYIFDSPETQRRAESLGRGGVATPRTEDAATSGMPEDAEPATRLLEHEERVSVVAEPAPGALGPLNLNLGNYRTGARREDDDV